MTDPRRTHYADQLADSYDRLNMAAAWLRLALSAQTETPPEAIIQQIAMNAVQTILGKSDPTVREDAIRNVCTIHAVSLYEYVKAPKLPHPPPDSEAMLECGTSHLNTLMTSLRDGTIGSREQLVTNLHAMVRDSLTIQTGQLKHLLCTCAVAILALAERDGLVTQ